MVKVRAPAPSGATRNDCFGRQVRIDAIYPAKMVSFPIIKLHIALDGTGIMKPCNMIGYAIKRTAKHAGRGDDLLTWLRKHKRAKSASDNHGSKSVLWYAVIGGVNDARRGHQISRRFQYGACSFDLLATVNREKTFHVFDKKDFGHKMLYDMYEVKKQVAVFFVVKSSPLEINSTL